MLPLLFFIVSPLFGTSMIQSQQLHNAFFLSPSTNTVRQPKEEVGITPSCIKIKKKTCLQAWFVLWIIRSHCQLWMQLPLWPFEFMVLSVQRGATQYTLGTPLRERLFRYFKQKTLNCPHIKTSSIFRYKSDLLGCSFSVPGLLNKIPALILQIQRVFKKKVIFKEFSRTEQFFQACANHV